MTEGGVGSSGRGKTPTTWLTEVQILAGRGIHGPRIGIPLVKGTHGNQKKTKVERISQLLKCVFLLQLYE